MDKENIIKNKRLADLALRWLTEVYPDKFGERIDWGWNIEGEKIILIGNFEIFETETYEKEIEIDGEKKRYTIFLKPLKKVA